MAWKLIELALFLLVLLLIGRQTRCTQEVAELLRFLVYGAEADDER